MSLVTSSHSQGKITPRCGPGLKSRLPGEVYENFSSGAAKVLLAGKLYSVKAHWLLMLFRWAKHIRSSPLTLTNFIINSANEVARRAMGHGLHRLAGSCKKSRVYYFFQGLEFGKMAAIFLFQHD